MKKLIGAALAIIMLVSAAMSLSVGAVIYEADTYTLGDANGDGRNDARDILAIRRSIVGSGTIVLAAADVNFDGVADARDVLKMRRAAVGALELNDGGNTVAAVTVAGVNINRFCITYADDASENIKFSARELQKYLKQASGIEVPITPDDFTGEHMIVYANDGALGEDGINIKVTGGSLYITGGTTRGCMNATYDFLERFVGWVFVNGDFTYLYKNDVVDIPEGTDFSYTPNFLSRDSQTYSYTDNDNPEKYLRLKIDSTKGRGVLERNMSYGGGEGYIGTAHTIIEYTACTNEQQPCFSSADVLEEVIPKVIANIAAKKAKGDLTDRISVSPMDTSNYCTCSACIGNRPKIAPINYKTDGYVGPQLNFINKIADAVKEVYPETHVLTTAYWEARIPPKTFTPRDNVDILYCWNGCNKHSFDGEDCAYTYGKVETNGKLFGYFNNKTEKSYFEGWTGITDTIIVWIYATSYSAMLGQPTFTDSLLDTIQYLARPEFGVMGIYCEGYYGTPDEYRDGNCFDTLTMYLFARAMWDPGMTEEEYQAYISEFLMVYYGGGSEELRKYLEICDTASGRVGHCWTNNFSWVFDAIDRTYYAEHSEEIFTLIDTALASEMTEAQRKNTIHLAASAYWLTLSATYDDEYTAGTPAQREIFEQRYTQLHSWILDYDIVNLDGGRNYFTTELNFNDNPYKWCGMLKYEMFGPEGVVAIENIPN